MIETAEINDPAAAAVFSNPRQRKILLALIAQERSLTGLAGLTGAPLNLLHYHMRKFLRLGLVRITRQEARAGAPIKFYRAAAQSFFVPAELATATPGDAMSVSLRAALDRGLAGALKGHIYSHDGAGPRMRVVHSHPQTRTAAEFWLDLRLSEADAAALAGEFQALLRRFEARAGDAGHRYIVHAALALS